MKRIFAFCSSVYNSLSRYRLTAGRRAASILTAWAQPLFLVGISFLVSCLLILIQPRTFLLGGYFSHPQWTQPLVGMVAMCLLIPYRGPWRNGLPMKEGRWLLALAPLVAFVPTTIGIGLGLLAITGLALCLSVRRFAAVADRFLLTSGLWLLCLFLSNVYSHVVTRTSNYAWLAYPLSLLLRALGLPCSSEGGTLSTTVEGMYHSALASPDKFALEFVVMFAGSLLLAAVLFRLSFRAVLQALAILAAYTLARTAWLISSHMVTNSGDAWWSEVPTILSFLPLLPMLIVTLKATTQEGDRPATDVEQKAPSAPTGRFRWRIAWQPVCVFLGPLFLTVGWLWVDPGTQKQGKILIDERYSRWEWSEKPIDTKLYGVKTVYSYYTMVESLAHYYPVERNFADITDNLLRGVSVLVLKTPTEPYPEPVRQAIWRFVEQGGGVWMIGDHTDVFGMDTYLNMLAGRYGVHFKFNAAVDPETNRQLYVPTAISHPIVRRLPLFLWYTSDTLEAPWFSNDVINTPRILVDNPDFSVNTFFGNFQPDLDEPVGPVVQAVALPSGAGRIAAWSDSTLFSNFAISLPGKMPLALGYVDWLNHRNSSFPVRTILLLAGSLTLLAGFSRFRQAWVTPGLWVGLTAGTLLTSLCYDRFYPEPHLNHPFESVAFYEPNVQSHLPVSTAMMEATPDEYLTASIAAQRAGKNVFVADTLSEAYKAKTLVIVHSHADFTNTDIAGIYRWVRDGGSLILLDGGTGSSSTLARLLEPSGIRVRELSPEEQTANDELMQWVRRFPGLTPLPEVDSTRLYTIEGQRLNRQDQNMVLSGGTPIVINETGQHTTIARIAVGKGQVIASSTTDMFSDTSLGENSKVPTDRQLVLLNLLYNWFTGN